MRRIPFALFALVLYLGALGAAAHAQISGAQAADAITRLNQGRDASVVANSVDTGTGSFSMEATVLSVNGARPLDFRVLYDSIGIPAFIVARPRDLGSGWTHPYAPFGTPLVHRDAAEPAISAWLDHVAQDSALPALMLLPYLCDDGPFAAAVLVENIE